MGFCIEEVKLAGAGSGLYGGVNNWVNNWVGSGVNSGRQDSEGRG